MTNYGFRVCIQMLLMDSSALQLLSGHMGSLSGQESRGLRHKRDNRLCGLLFFSIGGTVCKQDTQLCAQISSNVPCTQEQVRNHLGAARSCHGSHSSAGTVKTGIIHHAAASLFHQRHVEVSQFVCFGGKLLLLTTSQCHFMQHVHEWAMDVYICTCIYIWHYNKVATYIYMYITCHSLLFLFAWLITHMVLLQAPHTQEKGILLVFEPRKVPCGS